MDEIFNCQTTEAYFIKVLVELLASNLKTACLGLSKTGINMCMYDNPKKTLITMELNDKNFNEFKYDFKEENTCIGINLSYLHKILRSIKKKDELRIFISKDNLLELQIETISKDGNNTNQYNGSTIRIQDIQKFFTPLPIGYERPIIVQSTKFQKMIKDLVSIGSSSITLTTHSHHINFTANAEGILSRTVSFGNISKSNEKTDNIFVSTFSTDQLTRMIKISCLSQNIKIYPGTDLRPIMFETNIGTLGTISIYIKSHELIEKYSQIEESSYQSDSD